MVTSIPPRAESDSRWTELGMQPKYNQKRGGRGTPREAGARGEGLELCQLQRRYRSEHPGRASMWRFAPLRTGSTQDPLEHRR